MPTWVTILIAVAVVLVIIAARAGRSQRLAPPSRPAGPSCRSGSGRSTTGWSTAAPARTPSASCVERETPSRLTRHQAAARGGPRGRSPTAGRRPSCPSSTTPRRRSATAETLVQQVMSQRGYPSQDDLAAQASDLSVEHARQLSNLRAAQEISAAASAGRATTEDLRQAMVRYRALFADLLRAGTRRAGRLPRRAPANRSRSSGTEPSRHRGLSSSIRNASHSAGCNQSGTCGVCTCMRTSGVVASLIALAACSHSSTSTAVSQPAAQSAAPTTARATPPDRHVGRLARRGCADVRQAPYTGFDVDGDGAADTVTTRFLDKRRAVLDVHLGNGKSLTSKAFPLYAGEGAGTVSGFDINGDHRSEVFVEAPGGDGDRLRPVPVGRVAPGRRARRRRASRRPTSTSAAAATTSRPSAAPARRWCSSRRHRPWPAPLSCRRTRRSGSP